MFDEFDNFSAFDSFGELELRNTVTVQDHMGRFMAQVEEINAAATEDALQVGRDVARVSAPSKTGRMIASIDYQMTGPKSGTVSVGTNHWRYMEYGARPHQITGWVRFWWAREGRWWHPGRNIIYHPGVLGHYFMARGFEAAKQELKESMKRRYRAKNAF